MVCDRLRAEALVLIPLEVLARLPSKGQQSSTPASKRHVCDRVPPLTALRRVGKEALILIVAQ
jgi:hypothetical protein